MSGEVAASTTNHASLVQTEIGALPSDWVVKPAHEFAKIITGPFGTLLKAYEYCDTDGVPLISVGEIREGFLRLRLDTPHVPEAVVRRLPQYILRAGDIVFGRKGGVERSALIRGDQDGWFLGSDGICMRPAGANHSGYLAFQFNSRRVQDWLLQHAIGTTMPSLNQEILSRVLIPFPPTQREQKAIAAALSDADSLIEGLKSLIAKKRAIKQGAMQELLSAKKDWIELRLGDAAQLKARIGWQGLTTAEYLDSGEYNLVTGTDFGGGFIDWDNCHFVEKGRYEQDKYIQLKENDVLVTKDGTIGKVAFIDHLPRPATLNSGVFVIRPVANSVRPKFLYYILMSPVFDDFLARLSAGSTINHLYQKDFVGFTFSVPPTRERQEEIASILLDMDIDIKAAEARLEKAHQIKQGMMQELLTGRARLV